MSFILTDGAAVLTDPAAPLAGAEALASGLVTSGLVAAWEGDAGLATDGAGIVSWTDPIGGLVLSRLTPDYAPDSVISPGGTPAARIDSGSGMTAAAPAGLPQGAASRSLMVAMRFWGYPFYGGFGWGSNASGRAFTLSVDAQGVLGLDYFNGRISGSPADPGRWVVLCATYDGAAIAYSEDGVELGTVPVLLDTGADQINVARSFSGTTTECDIGAALIYNRVLSATEIAQNLGYLRGRYITDLVAPSLSAPVLLSPSSGTLSYSVTTDEAGGTLYVAAETGATPLTPTEMRARTALPGPLVGANTGLLDGLAPSTTYHLQAMQEDAAGNASAVVVSAGLATTAPDTTAPTLSAPTAAANGANGYTGGVTSNEAGGTLFWVLTGSATAPSGAQVIAGQDHSGSATGVTASSQPVAASGAQALSGAGLSGGSSYHLHAAQRDAAGNVSAVISAAAFTTASVTAAQPEGHAVVGDWAYIPNIVAANYAPPAHTKTANPGSFASIVAGAADGDVIRLDAGSYGSHEINGLRPAGGITIAAQGYLGATFGHLALYNCANVRLMGVRATSKLDVQKCDGCEIDWAKAKSLDWGARDRTGTLSYTFRSLPANQGGTLRRTIVDREWPSGAGGKIQAAIIGDTDNMTLRNCMVIRGNEDAMKFRGVKGGLIEEVFTGFARVEEQYHDSSSSSTDYHGDSAQFEGYSGWENEDIAIRFSAFVSPNFSGYRTSQGLFMKDGTHRRYTIQNVIGSASLNGNSIVTEEFHSDTLIENCDAFGGVIRCSKSSNTVRDSICRFIQVESGYDGPSQSGNVTYGSPASQTSVYQGTDRASFDDYLLQASVTQSKGAAELKALIIARRAAVA